jgi:hypothetical protein
LQRIEKINIAIIGSRNFNDEALFLEKITPIISEIKKLITIISGGASGADALAENYAHQYNFQINLLKRDWKHYGRAARAVRNTEIFNKSDMVIALELESLKVLKTPSLGLKNLTRCII